MILIKCRLAELPEQCDQCPWYTSEPHPYKGWTDMCGLMCHSMDEEDGEDWCYEGNGRPKMCPLVEVTQDVNEIEEIRKETKEKAIDDFLGEVNATFGYDYYSDLKPLSEQMLKEQNK